MRKPLALILVWMLGLNAGHAPAFAQNDSWHGGAETTLSTETAGNAQVVGAVVEVRAPVGGDLTVWGADVIVTSPIAGSASLYAARASLSAQVGRDLTVSTATAELAPTTEVGGATVINAARANVAGTYRGPLTVRAETVRLAATVAGPAEITARRLIVEPGAEFTGGLTLYTDHPPQPLPAGAVVKPIAESPVMVSAPASSIAARLSGALMLVGVGLIAGLIFLWLGRGAVEDAIDSLVERTGWSGFVGLIALIAIPLAAVLLAVTLVGAPLAVFMLLALPLMLLLGLAVAGFGVGEFMLNRTGEPRSTGARVLMLLLGLAVVALAAVIPYIGPFLGFLATLFGFGALLRALGHRLGMAEAA